MTGGSPGGARRLPLQPAAVVATARRGVLVVLLLASTLTVMAGALLAPVVELIRRHLEVSTTAAGLVVTGHGLTLASTGVSRSVEMARTAARRSAASSPCSPTMELTNTRSRRSGVRMTASTRDASFIDRPW